MITRPITLRGWQARAELETAVLAEREACATGRPANINAASC